MNNQPLALYDESLSVDSLKDVRILICFDVLLVRDGLTLSSSDGTGSDMLVRLDRRLKATLGARFTANGKSA